jgi:hypothetical protein
LFPSTPGAGFFYFISTMRNRIHYSGLILRILPKRFRGITIFPFGIYIRKPITYYQIESIFYCIDHEMVHWQQQKEMLIIFFYVWYFLEWIIKGFLYRNISFEREARNLVNDLHIINRKPFGWLKYL